MRIGRRIAASVVMAVAAASAGCAARATGAGGDAGQLTVGVSASGPRVAGLTFRLIVEPGGINRPINADAGVFTTSRAPAGTLAVSLSDVPERCRVEGGPRRDVVVGPARYPVVRFVVVCT
jgi:hypothetical protein